MAKRPANRTIEVVQGDPFNQGYVWGNKCGPFIDLTGCTIEGTIAQSFPFNTTTNGNTNTTICDISGSVTVPISGGFTLYIPPAVTGAIQVPAGINPGTPECKIGVYDVVVTWPDGSNQTIMNGDVKFIRTVTNESQD